jgi:2,4-dienoyl-CoA reductase-like NADH-dependent reductase (Old Yellow Enzyme family)
MSPELQKLLSPAKLGGLELRNRVIKTATFEGLTPQAVPTQALTDFHVAVVKGGVGLTTVGQCNVSADARNLDNEMYLHDGIRGGLRQLTDAVHAHGGQVSAQFTHCGYFKLNKPVESTRVLSPSFKFNKLGAPYGRPFAYAMTHAEIDKTVTDYVRSAVMARETGFDAIEIMMCHGYLLNQFMSANINRRSDEYGGSLENRMRFPLRVVREMRAAVGRDFPLLAKINLDDACKGGLTIDDAVAIARMLDAAGIDGLVTSAGRSPGNTAFMFRGESPIPFMIERLSNPFMKLFLKLFGHLQFSYMPYQELYLLDMARQIRKAVKCSVIYLGGVSSVQGMETCMREGFDFVAMGRALINDPQMVNRIARDPGYKNGCTHCNQCVALIYDPEGVRCVLNSAGGGVARA